jgi:hypothetical protein
VAATVVLVTLLLAPATSGGAAPPAACKTYARGGPSLPAPVSQWLAHSPDERVVMCPQAAAPGSEPATALYFGEGGVTQHGTVCTYLRHLLTVTGSGGATRLERYDRSEASAMALAGPECPAPHAATSAQGYVETYDISTSTFVGIMGLWSAIVTGPPTTHSGAGGAKGPAAGARESLRTALSPHAGGATVMRIVRIPGSVWRHRYALFIKAAGAAPGASAPYVIYVDKALRGPYEITAFAETN